MIPATAGLDVSSGALKLDVAIFVAPRRFVGSPGGFPARGPSSS
jgi:hypothetical protein